MPSEALQEIRHGPYPLVWEVLEVRAYARTKAQMDQADDNGKGMDEYPDTDLMTEVLKNRRRLADQKRAERRAQLAKKGIHPGA